MALSWEWYNKFNSDCYGSNTSAYSCFNEEQLEVIHKYFRFRTVEISEYKTFIHKLSGEEYELIECQDKGENTINTFRFNCVFLGDKGNRLSLSVSNVNNVMYLEENENLDICTYILDICDRVIQEIKWINWIVDKNLQSEYDKAYPYDKNNLGSKEAEEFIRVNLPLPEKLKREESDRYKTNKILDKLHDKYSNIEKDTLEIILNSDLYICEKAMLWLLTKKTEKSDEAIINLILYIINGYEKFIEQDVKADKLIKSIKKKLFYLGDRIATYEEWTNGEKGLKEQYLYCVDKCVEQYLLDWNYFIDGETPRDTWEDASVKKILLDSRESIKYVLSDKFDIDCYDILEFDQKLEEDFYESYGNNNIESIEDIVYKLRSNFPTELRGKDIDIAKDLIYQVVKKNKKLSVKQSALLRSVYDRAKDNKHIGDTKRICMYILQARENGLIRESDFVFRIISTLSSYEYQKKPSEKQMKILEEAYNFIKNKEKGVQIH